MYWVMCVLQRFCLLSVVAAAMAGETATNYKSPYQYSGEPFRADINQEDKKHELANDYLLSNGMHTHITSNPLVTALMLSSNLGIQPKPLQYNHPDHLPINPYIALLLSHYGKYVPIYGANYGLHAYNVVNNYHNNKPFGSYKVHEEQ